LFDISPLIIREFTGVRKTRQKEKKKKKKKKKRGVDGAMKAREGVKGNVRSVLSNERMRLRFLNFARQKFMEELVLFWNDVVAFEELPGEPMFCFSCFFPFFSF
jgi:hypothetical protein